MQICFQIPSRVIAVLLAVCLPAVFSCVRHTVPQPELPPGNMASEYPLGQKPYEINGKWFAPIPSARGYIEEGQASWYGSEFHRRPTSSGEPYNMHALTAAHKILPLGTFVKVTRFDNDRSVVLRINDRGPFVSGRIIDLSLRAAELLDMIQPGTALVRIEAVQQVSEQTVNGETLWKHEPLPDFRHGIFSIQIGAFEELENAFKLKKNISKDFKNIFIKPSVYMGRGFYRVHVGKFHDLFLANKKALHLIDRGFKDAFVVAMDGGE